MRLLLEFLITASCSLDAAAIGVCECGAPAGADSFQVCATERIAGREDLVARDPAHSPAKPMRLCSWYANGTIDSPTLSIITAWVPVGSRPCIGDVPAEPAARTKSFEAEVSDVFGASSKRPLAYWEPGGELEVLVKADFIAQLAAGEFEGTLLGRAARIRFEPVEAQWEFSDGTSGSGFIYSRTFESKGAFTAVAKVRVKPSYRFAGGEWQQSNVKIWLQSNELSISVVEIPRRTLLIMR